MTVSLPRCIFFDLDGTLLDSLPGIEWAVRAAFTACGVQMQRTNIRAEIGPPIRTILSRLAGEIESTQLDALERSFRTLYDTEGWKKTFLYPNASAALRSLRERGHRLFIVSNKPGYIASRILESEGVLGLFEDILTRDGRTPPYSGKEQMIALLVDAHALATADCVMVGDTIEDAEAAAAHALSFVFMTHGYGSMPVNGPIPVAARLDGFAELLTTSVGG